MRGTREEQILRALAEVTGTLVDGYDMVDALQNLVESSRDLLDVAESGILLTADNGELDLVVSTSETERLVELFLRAGESGPSLATVRTNRAVSVGDLEADSGRWAALSRDALALGFRSMHSVPLRLRDSSIGALAMFSTRAEDLDPTTLIAAQTLADVATITILHERAVRESTIVVEQLQTALKSRVVIEQAKGVVAQTLGVSIDTAFDVIRGYARRHRVGLSATAEQIVARTLTLGADDVN
jgi:transcriptional regulator with GAF, ATPase, and Fis domain